MAPLASAALLLAASAVVNAHFTLDYPPTIGFDEDTEDTGPCGKFTPDFAKDNVTDFHVGGDNVAINLLHPQGTWLYRATLDQAASSNNNWTQLFPEVLQAGIGKFCQPAIAVPESWAGKKGVIGVVVDAPDGLLYQCAAVNFVEGAATKNQSTCTNSSGVTASYVTDSKLADLTSSSNDSSSSGGGSSSTTGGGSSTPTGTSTGGSSSSTGNAAPGRVGGSIPLGGAAGVVLAAMLGSAYMML